MGSRSLTSYFRSEPRCSARCDRSWPKARRSDHLVCGERKRLKAPCGSQHRRWVLSGCGSSRLPADRTIARLDRKGGFVCLFVVCLFVGLLFVCVLFGFKRFFWFQTFLVSNCFGSFFGFRRFFGFKLFVVSNVCRVSNFVGFSLLLVSSCFWFHFLGFERFVGFKLLLVSNFF